MPFDDKLQRRSVVKQRWRRGLEEEVRQEAVGFSHWAKARGGTMAEAAKLLDVKPRTLRQWSADSQTNALQIIPLGRPPAQSDPHRRNEVIGFLDHHGPTVSVSTLREYFPGMARAELDHLRHRYRRVLRKRYQDTVPVLRWPIPGRVWALDFAEPSEIGSVDTLPPVDGLFSYLLAVRDLASGYILAWLPLPDMTATVLVPILRQLFARYGPPLVLKSDNGSAFRATETKRFLEQAEVVPLYSPPRWPVYNGAIEAGIGSLKIRTDLHAALYGRNGSWTSDDLAAAVQQANTHARYHGHKPATVWNSRTPIRPGERVRFHLTVQRQRFQACLDRRIDVLDSLNHWRHSAIDRLALRRALVEHGYLLVLRRPIPLGVS
jgi:putative transposase